MFFDLLDTDCTKFTYARQRKLKTYDKTFAYRNHAKLIKGVESLTQTLILSFLYLCNSMS